MLDGPKAHCLFPPRTVHYNQTNSKHLVFSVAAIPEQLQGQMSVLRYFASYMEQHLMKVGGVALGWAGIMMGRLDVGSQFDHTAWDCVTPCSQAVARWTPIELCPGSGDPGGDVSRFGCVHAGGSAPQWLTQTFLSKGGDLPSIDDLGQPALLLLQWFKTDQALLMLFSSGTLQVCVGHNGDAQTPMGGRPTEDSFVRPCLPQSKCEVQL